MNDINQVIDNIKDMMYDKKFISYLSDLRVKEEYQSLSDIEFFDIIGQCFKLNPQFFMKALYKDIRIMAKKQFGKEGRRIMEKYILERYCLYEGEQIFYIGEGYIQQKREGRGVRISGTLFVTNNRIIVQGKIKKKDFFIETGTIFDLLLLPGAIAKSGIKGKIKETVVEASVKQELPCYGYQFKNHIRHRRKGKGVIIDGTLYGTNKKPVVEGKIKKISWISTSHNRER